MGLRKEIWRVVKGFPNYHVSNTGNVRSIDRTINNVKRKGVVLAQFEVRRYLKVTLQEGKNIKAMLVHRVVAGAFLENKKKLPCVNHIYGNRYNNNDYNLEWCTYRQNTLHAIGMGLITRKKGEESGRSKISDNQVCEILNLLKTGFSQNHIAKKYSISQSLVSRIKLRKR